MPLPMPNSGESRNDFVSRCMSNPTMKQDFSDNNQRLAVCFRQFKKSTSKQFQYVKHKLIALKVGELNNLGQNLRVAVACALPIPFRPGTEVLSGC